jgi:hypothetical protein
MEPVPFETLKGLVLDRVYYNKEEDTLTFSTRCGRKFVQRHNQSCCEQVYIEEIHGDLEDVLNNPLLLAEEVSSTTPPNEDCVKPSNSSWLWTFYKLSTIKGSVTIRWYGESNGYYSEAPHFFEYLPMRQ